MSFRSACRLAHKAERPTPRGFGVGFGFRLGADRDSSWKQVSGGGGAGNRILGEDNDPANDRQSDSEDEGPKAVIGGVSAESQVAADDTGQLKSEPTHPVRLVSDSEAPTTRPASETVSMDRADALARVTEPALREALAIAATAGRWERVEAIAAELRRRTNTEPGGEVVDLRARR